jgi:hypothetical protein
MNCVVGDIARIVWSQHEQNRDRIVHVEEAVSPGVWLVLSAGSPLYGRDESGAIVQCRGGCIEDRNLRPLRGQEGADETLMWAGLPRRTSPAQPLTT